MKEEQDVRRIEKMASFMYEYAPKDHDWSDVKLVPQYDGPDPVVAIMYTEECKLPVYTHITATHTSLLSYCVMYPNVCCDV